MFSPVLGQKQRKINKIDIIDKPINTSRGKVAYNLRRPPKNLHAKFGPDRFILRDFYSEHTNTHTNTHTQTHTQTNFHFYIYRDRTTQVTDLLIGTVFASLFVATVFIHS